MAITKISRSLLDTGVSDSSDATAITIDSSERVGIGTTSPGRKVVIAHDVGTSLSLANSGSSVYLQIAANGHDNDNSNYIGADSSKNFTFWVSNTERMRIDNSGNVGIGTTSPSSKFSVKADQENLIDLQRTTTTTGAAYTKFINDGGNYYIGVDSSAGNRLFASGGAAYALSLSTESARDICLGTNNTERMRIDNSGNVLVGTTSLVDSNCTALHTKATASTKWVQAMSGVDRGMVVYSTLTSGTTLFHYFIYNGSVVGSISSTGSSTAYNTTSDYRLKENVDYTWDATTRLKQLKPARFNFKSDETNTLVDGFLAHEVSGIVPEAITGEKDGAEMQGIDQSKLVPLLVKTIQELEARITTLEG